MIDLFDQRFPAELGNMAELRRVLRDGLTAKGVPEEFSERLVLVVDEVVSNAIEHGYGYRKTSEPIRVHVSYSEEGLILMVDDVDVPDELVSDLAQEFDNRADIAPEALLERGRGMFLITTLLEDLEITRAEGRGMRLRGRLQESRY